MKELYEIIGGSSIKGYIVKLPDIELDRKTYNEIKKAMKFIDGEWIGGKVGGFLFEENPTLRLQSILNKEYTVDTKKQSQFFETPKVLADRMAYELDAQSHDLILEPSVGRGALVQSVLDTDRENICISQFRVLENLKMNRDILKEKYPNINIIGNDFEKLKGGSFNKIIANPPFSANRDLKHLFKMLTHLSRFGTLVCLISNHYENSNDFWSRKFKLFNSELFEYWFNVDLIDISKDTFKESGTSIPTTLVVIRNINECGAELEDMLKNITNDDVDHELYNEFKELYI